MRVVPAGDISFLALAMLIMMAVTFVGVRPLIGEGRSSAVSPCTTIDPQAAR